MAGALAASSLVGSSQAAKDPSEIPQSAPKPPQMAQSAMQQPQAAKIEAPQHDKKHILEALSFLESSGGKNLNHPEIAEGPHAGTKAIGKFALMPSTIKDLVSKSPKLKSKYPQILDAKDQEDYEIAFKDNPDLENDVAGHYLDEIGKQTGAKTAGDYGVAWLHGAEGYKKMAQSGKLQDNERYQKAMAAYDSAKKLHGNKMNYHLSNR